MTNVNCPQCHHEFDASNVVFTAKEAPIIEYLTDAARSVYDRQITGILFEVPICKHCQVEMVMPQREDLATIFSPSNSLDKLTEAKQKFSKDHEDCGVDNRELLVRQCVFLGVVAETSFAQCMMDSDAVFKSIAKATEQLSKVFNRCVENKWVNYGMLAPCFTVPLAPLVVGSRTVVLLYVGSDYSREKLNELVGVPAFVQDGELPTAWSL